MAWVLSLTKTLRHYGFFDEVSNASSPDLWALYPVSVHPVHALPATLEYQAQAALDKVKTACVSIEGGSGVIISPEGYILTAAHILGDNTYLKVELDDGRKAFAVPVGANLDADFGLARMVIPTEKFECVDPEALPLSETSWPHVELASRAPEAGAFCFVLGHPAGRVPGRPAQFRLGRITHLRRDGPFSGWLWDAYGHAGPGSPVT